METYIRQNEAGCLGEASHIDFVYDERHMDVEKGGGFRLAPVTFLSEKWWENFDSKLLKIFNILKSSVQSIQNPAFS